MRVSLKDTFRLMKEGTQVLQVSKAEGKPASKPITIEITFKNSEGDTIKNNYTLDDKNEKGMIVTSILLKSLFGNIDEFDTSSIPEMVGKYCECEIVHNKVPKKDDESQIMTFANIKKIIGGADGFTETEPETEPETVSQPDKPTRPSL